MKFKLSILLLVTIKVIFSCDYDYVCNYKVKNAFCADGSVSGYWMIRRKFATALFIYLEGGGACWDKVTCNSLLSSHLSEHFPKEGDYFSNNTLKKSGILDLTNPQNPFSENYNIVGIPYCTGDIFSGSNTINYGDDDTPFVVRHVGFTNLVAIVPKIKEAFPIPSKVVIYGESAGGLGAAFALRLFVKEYGKVYVINDSGIPFSHPFIEKDKLDVLFTNWGSYENLPESSDHSEGLSNIIIKYNKEHLPYIRYGFIASYRDIVMTLFARLVDSNVSKDVIRNIIIWYANLDFFISDDYHKVYYVDDWWHSYFLLPPQNVTSLGKKYSTWLMEMINDEPSWGNIRPDQSAIFSKIW